MRRHETEQCGDIRVCQVDFQLLRLDPRHVEQIVHVLQEHAGVASDDLAGLAPLGQAHRPGIVDQTLRRPEDQGKWRAKLVADVGEELRLDLVELANPFEQPLQLDVLLGDLALLRLLLGDVAPFAGEEHDLALIVLHGHDRGVDDDGDRAVGTRVERRVPADELALHCARDGVADALVDLRRHLPPERGPERFAFHVGRA